MRTLLVILIAVTLLISGLLHLINGRVADRLMSNARNVRLVGIWLLVLGAPCFRWRGGYFMTLGALLAISGALRLFAPHFNIRLQTGTYPRRVHGLLLLTGAALTWLGATATKRPAGFFHLTMRL